MLWDFFDFRNPGRSLCFFIQTLTVTFSPFSVSILLRFLRLRLIRPLIRPTHIGSGLRNNTSRRGFALNNRVGGSGRNRLLLL